MHADREDLIGFRRLTRHTVFEGPETPARCASLPYFPHDPFVFRNRPEPGGQFSSRLGR